jgi:creatinine amidohydrolase/Fe(II)-dependent formamide hydrolase-like protein
MYRFLSVTLIVTLATVVVFVQAGDPVPDNTVGRTDTVFIEEMTADEVGAALRSGMTSVIVATGGVEQNGPHVVTGKHNYVLQVTADAIARAYGDTLVAPVVKFVPEGNIDPPDGHMRYPGTMSLGQETFEALLTDICRSLRQHGFKDIFLIADSGGNLEGIASVASALNERWAGEDTRVHDIVEYYAEDIWSYDYMKSLGYVQLPDEKTPFRNNIHTDLHYEAIVSLVDPELVRANARLEGGGLSVHGVELESIDELQEIGRKLTAYRTKIAVDAMRSAASKSREES